MALQIISERVNLSKRGITPAYQSTRYGHLTSTLCEAVSYFCHAWDTHEASQGCIILIVRWTNIKGRVMTGKAIYVVHSPSPTLVRLPLQKVFSFRVYRKVYQVTSAGAGKAKHKLQGYCWRSRVRYWGSDNMRSGSSRQCHWTSLSVLPSRLRQTKNFLYTKKAASRAALA